MVPIDLRSFAREKHNALILTPARVIKPSGSRADLRA
jgi:hypothetical protein